MLGNDLLRVLRLLLTDLSDRNHCTPLASQVLASAKADNTLHEQTWKQRLEYPLDSSAVFDSPMYGTSLISVRHRFRMGSTLYVS